MEAPHPPTPIRQLRRILLWSNAPFLTDVICWEIYATNTMPNCKQCSKVEDYSQKETAVVVQIWSISTLWAENRSLRVFKSVLLCPCLQRRRSRELDINAIMYRLPINDVLPYISCVCVSRVHTSPPRAVSCCLRVSSSWSLTSSF